VSFLDAVDPVPHYAAADVYVQPTWYDPCSLVTLEAAACGLPVITTRYNGASELMHDGLDGYVLEDPHDVATLAARMQALLDPALRNTMGAAGRAVALQHTFERQTDEFLELYREIMERRAR
ncbi:MAG TPA: glycosyltransferase family 4 protein, partial [Chthoniobacterales bacterium]